MTHNFSSGDWWEWEIIIYFLFFVAGEKNKKILENVKKVSHNSSLDRYEKLIFFINSYWKEIQEKIFKNLKNFL